MSVMEFLFIMNNLLGKLRPCINSSYSFYPCKERVDDEPEETAPMVREGPRTKPGPSVMSKSFSRGESLKGLQMDSKPKLAHVPF